MSTEPIELARAKHEMDRKAVALHAALSSLNQEAFTNEILSRAHAFDAFLRGGTETPA